MRGSAAIPVRAALAAGAAAVAAGGAHVLPAAVWLPAVRARWFPVLDGRGRADHVALTFDDGPDPASTPLFLEELDRLEVRATFFLLGSRAARFPGLTRRIAEAGHETAVHGLEHERPWHPRPRADLRDLRAARDLVAHASGRAPLWYRPPYGVLTATRWAAARRAELTPVLWTAWGRDWTARADAGSVLHEVSKRLYGGATVLLHDSDCTAAPGAWRSALSALPGLVEQCRRRGLAVGPLAAHGLPAAH